jgi:hypothetical protein
MPTKETHPQRGKKFPLIEVSSVQEIPEDRLKFAKLIVQAPSTIGTELTLERLRKIGILVNTTSSGTIDNEPVGRKQYREWQERVSEERYSFIEQLKAQDPGQ